MIHKTQVPIVIKIAIIVEFTNSEYTKISNTDKRPKINVTKEPTTNKRIAYPKILLVASTTSSFKSSILLLTIIRRNSKFSPSSVSGSFLTLSVLIFSNQLRF